MGPALLGGTAFMFSDLFVMHFGNLNMIAVVAWLPLAFLLFALALERRSLPFAAWSGAALGISALAGHIQPTIYNGLLLALLAGYETWAAFPAAAPASAAPIGPADDCRRHRGSGVVAGDAALARPQPPHPSGRVHVLGGLSLLALTVSSPGLGATRPHRPGPRGLLGPGRPRGDGLPRPAALLLAGFAAWRLSRRPWVGFLTLAAVVSFVLALGDSLPLHGWLFQLVPGLDLLRAPARALYVTDFALAGLAAIGCQGPRRQPGGPLRRAVRRYLRPIRQAVLYAAPIALAASLLALLLPRTETR